MLAFDRERFLRWGASLLVSAILLAQAATLPLKLSGHSPHTWYWPIVDYPMYEHAHQVGEHVVSERIVEVELGDGTVERLSAEQLGLKFWNFLRLAEGLQKGNRVALLKLTSLYDRGQELVKVRVYSPPIMLSKHGAQKTTPKLLGEAQVETQQRKALR